jgi:hypothetical protein
VFALPGSGSKSADRNIRATPDLGYTGWRFTWGRQDTLASTGLGILVAQVVLRRSSGLVPGLVLILWLAAVPAVGQAQAAAGARTQKRMVRAVDKTFRDGLHAQLPPHISTLLGIAKEKECRVMQAAVRTGKVVQGFDVSMLNKNDVVLFAVDETTNDQTLYLTSAEGRLRRVVSVKAGVGEVRQITDADKKAFAKEKQFWLDRLAPVSASK